MGLLGLSYGVVLGAVRIRTDRETGAPAGLSTVDDARLGGPRVCG